MGSSFGPARFWVDGVLVSAHHGLNDAVLGIRLRVGLIECSLSVRFVFSEQQIDCGVAVEKSFSEETMLRADGSHVGAGSEDLQFRFLLLLTP